MGVSGLSIEPEPEDPIPGDYLFSPRSDNEDLFKEFQLR